jgi:2,3-dihydroxybenzoate decarboxylase
MKKIGLEEHFVTPDLIPHLGETYQNINSRLASRAVPHLQQLGNERIETMEAGGLDFAVLSIAGPGVQAEPDARRAVKLAKEANDVLAAAMQKNPTRYGGLAHLPMQDPSEAAEELERCIKDLKMQGAMVNGQTLGLYLDNPCYDGFWERAATLKAPVYIHPGNPVQMPITYAGATALWGPFWGWGVETASHALRMVVNGVFDRHPDARVILGHMGETLPYLLWRFDSRLPTAYMNIKLAHEPSYYIRKNIAITTSGVCDDVALRCALDNLGEDSVMFSADYPFEDLASACNWVENADIGEARRAKVAHENAESILLGLK